MTLDQMAGFKQGMAHRRRRRSGTSSRASTVPPAELAGVPQRGAVQRRGPPPHRGAGRRDSRRRCRSPTDKESSTQEGFGKILNAIAAEDSELSRRIVTTSPDVTVSTNLGAWVNRRGLFGHTEAEDVFRELKVVSAQLWRKTPRGQHIELGIAENNLFIQLAALGLSHELFGARLLPIGTLYDPFIARGLDALNYACYQDARFMLVATPSGVTLAPEGGAHQSDPHAADRHRPAGPADLRAGLRRRAGRADALWRLSTCSSPRAARSICASRPAACRSPSARCRPSSRATSSTAATGTPRRNPAPTSPSSAMGAVTPEAIAAHESVARDFAGAGLLVLTSPDRLHADWLAAQRKRGRTAGRVELGQRRSSACWRRCRATRGSSP